MDKYTLLLLLNLPFVVFGYLKTTMAYRTHHIRRNTFALRFLFWSLILLGLIFAEEIYDYAFSHNWTDSTPLSLPDVVLATGVMLGLFLSIRAHAKIDSMEKRLSDLHEKLSVYISEKR